jgi:hypothetical protein
MNYEQPPRIELLGGRVVIDVDELLARSRATDSDVIVLSGTLLEGFGNIYSDLDLYVICERLPTQNPSSSSALVFRDDGRVRRLNEVLPDSSNILLDVQYYTFRELETLARSLRVLHAESRQTTRIFRKSLHHEDEDLIHKLLTGRILRDGTGRFSAREFFEPGMFCFLKYRNEIGGYAEFRDLVGSWAAADLSTCLYNTRSYLIAQVSATMFLAGSTNPRPKWFIRRLQSLDGTFADLKEGILSWMDGARHTVQQKREAVESGCDLIDMAYQHVRALLGTSPHYFSVEEALEMTEREFRERGTEDHDAQAELQLRNCMFRTGAPPLRLCIQSPAPTLLGRNGSSVYVGI